MQLSVIVPTFNEAGNVAELITRLSSSLRDMDAEVLIIDDGTDHLPEIAANTKRDVPVRVVRRAEPTGRLGGAVLHGMRLAQGDLLVVCDGDLQHPPEVIPRMLEASTSSDLVVASRYVEGGDPGGLDSPLRKVVSRSTGLLTKLAFPARLRSCTDPMSGFFMVRRGCLNLDALRPKGFKILLEVIARTPRMRVTEVPFTFAERTAGESHATLSEGLVFLRQLALLRMGSSKAVLFMLVGLSGVLPNLGVQFILTNSGVPYVAASFIAIQVASVWNFLGAEFLVWRDHDAEHWTRRFAKFLLIAETDLLRIPFIVLLVQLMGGHSVTASAITLVAAFLLRFTLADRLVYRKPVIRDNDERIDHEYARL